MAVVALICVCIYLEFPQPIELRSFEGVLQVTQVAYESGEFQTLQLRTVLQSAYQKFVDQTGSSDYLYDFYGICIFFQAIAVEILQDNGVADPGGAVQRYGPCKYLVDSLRLEHYVI